MLAPGDMGAGWHLGAAMRHENELQDIRRMVGGVIGTKGVPVGAIRFDHGYQQAVDAGYLDKLRSLGLPFTFGFVTDCVGNPNHPYEKVTYTWAEVRALMRAYGGQPAVHSCDHMDPSKDGKPVWDQVVGAKNTVEAAGLRAVIHHAAGVPNCGVPHFSNNVKNTHADRSSLDHEYAGLVFSNYGIYNMLGTQGGQIRAMPTYGNADLGHFTLDTLTLAQANAQVDYVIARSGGAISTLKNACYGFEEMLHPRIIESGPTVHPDVKTTRADVFTHWEYLASLRDQGKIIMLTQAGMAFADPGSDQRANLIADYNFASGLVPGSSGANPWQRAGGMAGQADNITLATGVGPAGQNAVSIPAAAGFAYAYTGNSQLSSLGMWGGTVEVLALARCTGGGTTGARITILNPDASVGHIDYLNVEHIKSLPADNAWYLLRFNVTLPMGIKNLQYKINRHAGAGDLQFTGCVCWPV